MGRESSLTEGMDQLNILTPPAIFSKGIFKKRTAHHNLGKEFLYPFFCLFPLPKAEYCDAQSNFFSRPLI